MLDSPGGDPAEQAINWDSGVEAEGHGFPADGGANEVEERLTAVEAAKTQAMADLVEKLSGVSVSRNAEVRDMRFDGTETRVSLEGALTGVVTPGERIAAAPGNRILYRDGLPVAVMTGDNVRVLVPARPNEAWQFHQLLARMRAPAVASTTWRRRARGRLAPRA